MPLVDLRLPPTRGELPDDVRDFLGEADRRVEEFLARGHYHGFVPSDYEGAYHLLRGLATGTAVRGHQFCEWGSGFGVVACLASFAGFDACGIESEGVLVGEARRLADDFGLDVEFAHGSFVPRGGEARVYSGGEYAWLTTDSDYAYEELGLDPSDLDVVFAYPWPDEEAVTASLFDRYAGPGAVLATFHGGNGFRVRRKKGKRRFPA